MWEPRRLTTLWAFTVCYRDSFTFFFYLYAANFLQDYTASYPIFFVLSSLRLLILFRALFSLEIYPYLSITILKMEAACFIESLVTSYQITRRYIIEDRNLQNSNIKCNRTARFHQQTEVCVTCALLIH
jgi:hypothetical protein